MVDLRGPQGVPPVDQDHLPGDAAEQSGVLGGGVAAPHHHDGFPLVEHPVAVGAVVHPPAGELPLPGHPQLPGAGPGGDHHGAGQIGAAVRLHRLGICDQVHPRHLGEDGAGAEPLGLLPHLVGQSVPGDPLLKAWIIVDLMGLGHLAAGDQGLQYHAVQTGPGGVQGGGVPTGAAADDDHVVDMLHGDCSFFPGSPAFPRGPAEV